MFQRSIQSSELDRQTRRSFLKASTGAVASVAALGASGAVRGGKFGGDDGEYTAPAEFPLVSTRDQFNDDGTLKSEYTETEYETIGDWDSSRASDDTELVIFVHGWSLGETDARNAAYTCQIGLEENEYNQFNVGFTWDADKGDGIGWNEGVAIAKQNGPKLAQWVADHNDSGGLPVRLVGHSLGARVAVETVASLHERGREDAVKSVALLGGAIGESVVEVDEAYGESIEYATTSFDNFHKDDDAVLGTAFSAAEWTEAVGETGVQSPEDAPENYTEYDVTETVADHNSYYEPGEGCMPGVVETFQ
ncbi:DUF726 domain-containing protein [Haloarcula sp. CBA1127]|uniref:DUF726 domain-containing protein n=1 Tax=Haloarcula sp. CBA1127 TaxID=1765055 RepID=UPI000A9CE141|nr:DUF726 domain-containing protein [Haloarcula sp. CBA1127]